MKEKQLQRSLLMKLLCVSLTNVSTLKIKNDYPSFLKKSSSNFGLLLLLLLVLSANVCINAQKIMEPLNRALVAVKTDDGVFLSWRMFASDNFATTEFYLYRNDSLVNNGAITGVSNYVDSLGTDGSNYYLQVKQDGIVCETSDAVLVWENNYKEIAMQIPEDTVQYKPQDCSVADLDGDGEMELVVKMVGTERDNSQSGYTTPAILQAYEFNGSLLWEINLGINIRGGHHYTQFIVYDLDGDGKAEVACKTAPGSKDGTGNYLSTGPAASDDDSADYRTSNGYILSGPEYLTVFDGETGAEINTVGYLPTRGTEDGDTDIINTLWGDSYGNRVDRFLACAAYVGNTNSDGKLLPSLIMCRGYYTRIAAVAWDFDGESLTERWAFDTDTTSYSVNSTGTSTGKDGLSYYYYKGQGAHSLATGDVDGDGYDEIVYGAMTIDNDGIGLYTTGNCHGDATHLGDFIPSNPGLEFFMPSESANSTNKVTGGKNPTCWVSNAADGNIIWENEAEEKDDVGRAMCSDLIPDNPGCEFWCADGNGIYDKDGNVISDISPSQNFAVWWDGDAPRELLNENSIRKWTDGTRSILLMADGYESCNSTKATPEISGDILGDWREEVIFRSEDYTKLRIYTTTNTTDYGIYTLLQDPQYREAICWQNVGYNQPPHPSFYIGAGLDTMTVPTPDIEVLSAVEDPGIEITSPVMSDTIELGSYVYASVALNNVPDATEIYMSDDAGNVLDTVSSVPYIFDLGKLTEGDYTITAWYKDGGDTISSNPIVFTLDQGLPEISLVSPADGDIYVANNDILLSADATDSDGSIDTVRFYCNDSIVATVLDAPFNDTITLSEAGEWEVYAIATDNLGHTTQSSTHTIVLELYSEDEGDSIVIQEDETGFCGFTESGYIESNHDDYTGTGFANTVNSSGSGLSWKVNIPVDGTYKFAWRYAGTGSDRTADLYLNDEKQDLDLSFTSSGDWAVWLEDGVEVSVAAGDYSVTLISTTSSGLPNIDYIKIISYTGTTATAIACTEETTGIDDEEVNETANIQLYPNPADNLVNINNTNTAETIQCVSVYNLSGTLVYNGKFNTNQISINTGSLNVGMYMVKIETDESIYNEQLIIK